MYSGELLKGTLKPIILKLLSEQGKMYGYQIARRVKEISEGKILLREGSLYPSLHSLKNEGLLETETVMLGKRSRKYYSLTPAGKQRLPAMLQELNDFLHTLQHLLTPKTHSEICIA